MSKLVIAITGPAGSGKSTVAKKLAKKLKKCVNIEADHVKHFIVSGFHSKTLPDGTKKLVFSEWELVGDSIGLLARNFQERGYNVIINGYIDEPAWGNIMKHIELTHKFLLLPHIDETKNRDKQRDEHMGEEAVQEHHDYFSTADYYKDFIKLDSTNHTIEETLNEILKGIK